MNAIISKFQFRSEFNLRKYTRCNSRTFLAQTFRIKTNEPFTIVKFERRSLRLLSGNIAYTTRGNLCITAGTVIHCCAMRGGSKASTRLDSLLRAYNKSDRHVGYALLSVNNGSERRYTLWLCQHEA